MTTDAGSIRTIRSHTPPARREPRKRPSDAPRQPHIKLGMWVYAKQCCTSRRCMRNTIGTGHIMWHGLGPIVAKRGSQYLVTSRLYGSRWVTRDQMYVQDLTGRYWNQPLLVEEEK